MNLLDALAIVRNCAVHSPQIRTRSGQAALKIVDQKLQSLLRKKAWREGGGACPIHMGDESYAYQVPATPIDTASDKLRTALADAETTKSGARLADYADDIRELLTLQSKGTTIVG